MVDRNARTVQFVHMKNKNLLAIYLLAGLLIFSYLPPLLSQSPAPEAEKTEQAAPAEEIVTAEEESIFQWIIKGGSTMAYLGIIVVIIIGFALERYFYFKRSRVQTKGYYEKFRAALDRGIPDLEAFLKEDGTILSRILSEGMRSRSRGVASVEKSIENTATVEIGKLERGLNLLSNLGNLAPLLGFFGTVVGMRHSFLQFVVKAAPTAKDLAGGVEEALITTQAGLLIAIPTYLVYNLFLYSIDTVTIELERCANELSDRLS
ncbi:outer membrane transport energization protein ExbB [Leptonema illini DSM 21528]|uniref:Outer membrane transport energization protein ExbB n=2 Tax=Leptonema illini TaxID=183 RepID=H2CFV5_9LEPT|nr:outer membrane transport energization protein ExbB [Leptonema illini DSM 21528]PKL32311.1 MAG: MotA/TolQ/ExbB proton channel family protein [Spirochaetae bacterium HGW-Spirochaetae-10]